MAFFLFTVMEGRDMNEWMNGWAEYDEDWEMSAILMLREGGCGKKGNGKERKGASKRIVRIVSSELLWRNKCVHIHVKWFMYPTHLTTHLTSPTNALHPLARSSNRYTIPFKPSHSNPTSYVISHPSQIHLNPLSTNTQSPWSIVSSK